jgi:hypothetical protein
MHLASGFALPPPECLARAGSSKLSARDAAIFSHGISYIFMYDFIQTIV